jgi:hypothetical protein
VASQNLSSSIAACLLLCAPSGCATKPEIAGDGPDGYRIVAVGGTGFASSGSMKKKNYAQATEFCRGKDLVVETIDSDSKQARPLGGFPEATLRFKCVARN